MITLVAGKNKEGYLSTLLRTFTTNKMLVPSKSAFSQFRKRVSFRFFRDILFNHLLANDNVRQKYHGMYVYAIDGFETEIPRSDDIIKAGYSGRSLGSIRQTYYPRIYLGHCYDVINGLTKDLVVSKTNEELRMADQMVPSLESDSITLYDRLYFSKRLIENHTHHKNYYIARTKTEGGHKEIVEFAYSNEREKIIKLFGQKVRLFKIKNRKTKNEIVLATNLFFDWVSHETVYKLYFTRWEVEVSFRDLVQSLKIEDFHAKNINGVLQELYARFWLMNYTKIQVLKTYRVHVNPNSYKYSKPNYKILFTWMAENLKAAIDNMAELWNDFTQLVQLTIEKRTRRKRSYPRELKYSGKMYPRNSAIIITGGA
jgi:Transposase DDE domain